MQSVKDHNVQNYLLRIKDALVKNSAVNVSRHGKLIAKEPKNSPELRDNREKLRADLAFISVDYGKEFVTKAPKDIQVLKNRLDLYQDCLRSSAENEKASATDLTNNHRASADSMKIVRSLLKPSSRLLESINQMLSLGSKKSIS